MQPTQSHPGQYWRSSDAADLSHYGSKKASADREMSIVEGIRSELGQKFVREVDHGVV
jgi:hypothetical protein